MVERRILTPEFVDSATPPSNGERWVSDTKLRGFGLRLWATKSGGEKAFAIRVSDKDGRSVRRTFSLYYSSNYRIPLSRGEYTYQLGDCIGDAREWARDEIDSMKGRLTIREEEEIRRKKAADRVKKIPLQRAAHSVIEGMRTNGLSEGYIDQVFKLFSNHIPAELQETSLSEVSPRAVADILVSSNISPGNTRVLRSFIGQIYERAGSFHGPLHRFSRKMASEFWANWEDRYDTPFPELERLTETDYQRIFEKLDAENSKWQQALCIRLFFEFRAPLNRLMAAQWTQIRNGTWFPYRPDERVYWLADMVRIDGEAKTLLNRVLRLGQRDFGESRYWFPSRFGRKAEHIRTVDTIWRNTLHDIGSRYYPLRKYASHYRDLQADKAFLKFATSIHPVP